MLAALILGTAVFVLLAAVTAAVTRTVEMAQRHDDAGADGSRWSSVACCSRWPCCPGRCGGSRQALPLTRVVDLLRLGLTGTAPGGGHLGLAATFGAAAVPVLVLGGLDRGGRMGCATLVPVGTAALTAA